MKKLHIITTIAALILSAQVVYSQTKSGRNEIKIDKTYQVSGKSKTVKMKKGDTYNLTLDLKKDRAYYISVSGNKSLDNIQYRLVSENTESDILYDNSAYEFSNQTLVSVTEDSKVVLEIKTQPAHFLAQSSAKKDVNLFIASKKVKNTNVGSIENLIVLAANN